MITPDYARTLARYNRWQNRSLLREADALSDAARREPRGAFFGSIHGTLSHLMWGDAFWMHRFAGTPKPEVRIKQSAAHCPNWGELTAGRIALDQTIIRWADELDGAWLAGSTTWTRSSGGELTRPNWLLATHFFNHQTHHRGQVHAMMTAAGGRPDDTDLTVLPPDV